MTELRTLAVLDMNSAHKFIFGTPKGGGDGTKRIEKYIKCGLLQPLVKRCDQEIRRYFLMSDLKNAKPKILKREKEELTVCEKVDWKAKYMELVRAQNPKNFSLA